MHYLWNVQIHPQLTNDSGKEISSGQWYGNTVLKSIQITSYRGKGFIVDIAAILS